MKSRIVAFAALALAAVAALLVSVKPARATEDAAAVMYPDGYRAWTFLHASLVPSAFPGFSKSPCVKPCTNGIFYFYANDLAMKGFRTGTFADGAVIAEEMLEFRVGDKGNGGEGQRVLTAVMVKDSSRYASTGGWGYGNFNEGSKANTLDAKAQQTCHQCHVSRKDQGYVFTKYAER